MTGAGLESAAGQGKLQTACVWRWRRKCWGSRYTYIPSFDRIEAVAACCRSHWGLLDRTEGVLLANAIPEGLGLDPNSLEDQVLRAVAEAEQQGVNGAGLTPFLLGRLAETTRGEALDANISLLCSNASVATQLADAFMARS